MNLSFIRIFLYTFILMTSVSNNAYSALIKDVDFTTDTSTNYDWQLIGVEYRNYSKINTLIQPGGVLDGWQVASGDQLRTLLTSAGWQGVYGLNSTNNGIANTLASYFGYSFTGSVNGVVLYGVRSIYASLNGAKSDLAIAKHLSEISTQNK